MPPSVERPGPGPRAAVALGDHLRDVGRSAPATSTWPRSRTRRRPTRSTPSTRSPTTPSSAWFEERWPDVELVSEGLDEPLVLGRTAVDGDRRHDRRHPWPDVRQAVGVVRSPPWRPHGGSLRDVVAAAMTELPTSKQVLTDQYAATRGGGVTGRRTDLRTGDVVAARRCARRTATDLEHGFAQVAKFFPPGKEVLAAHRGRPVPAPRVPARCSTTSTSRPAASCTSC